MVLRAAQLQVFGRNYWQQQATDAMKKSRLIETTRGTIFDAKGKPIALDVACTDAAVDYRAVLDTPDPTWVAAQAVARVRRDLGDGYGKISSDARKQRIDKQKLVVVQDLPRCGGRWRTSWRG